MARKAAFCSQCARYVWLTPEGLCENGHTKPNLRDVRETDTLPSVAAGAASVGTPQPTLQPPTAQPTLQPPAAPAQPIDAPAVPAQPAVPAPPAAPWEAQAPVVPPAASPDISPTLLPPSTDLYADSVASAQGYPSATGLQADLAATGDPYLYAMMTEVQPAQTDVLGKRVIAFIIDSFILQVVQAMLGFALGIFLAIVTAGNVSEGGAMGAGYLMGVVVTLAYFTAFEAGLGYTPGKALFGLRVMNKDRSKISVGQALGRNAARFVDLLFMGLVGLFAARGSAYRQRFGDQWANTYVVRG